MTDDELVAALRTHPDPLRIIQAAKIAGPWIEEGRRTVRETFGAWGMYDQLVARIGPNDHAWVDTDGPGDPDAPMHALDPGTGKDEADAALLAAGWRLL